MNSKALPTRPTLCLLLADAGGNATDSCFGAGVGAGGTASDRVTLLTRQWAALSVRLWVDCTCGEGGRDEGKTGAFATVTAVLQFAQGVGDADLGGRCGQVLSTRRTFELEFHRGVDDILAASFAVRQSKTILARFYGSLKSPLCSCVSITLPTSS